MLKATKPKECKAKSRKQSGKEQGITLIALVITIIIIIILATITINMVFGDNGLIKQAELARDMAANSTIAEQEGMNSLMDDYANMMEENNSGDDDGYTEETTEDGKKVPVPAGFVISKATGENTVEGGLVIYEGTEDVTDENVEEARKNRNQFVWIPVDDYNSSETEYTDDIDEKAKIENSEIEDSIKKHGGFFVGRYENGTNNIVRKDQDVQSVTLEEALSNSRNMYTNNSLMVSTLIRGTQWDSIVNYLSDEYDISNSSEFGNYCDFPNYAEIDENNTSSTIVVRLCNWTTSR